MEYSRCYEPVVLGLSNVRRPYRAFAVAVREKREFQSTVHVGLHRPPVAGYNEKLPPYVRALALFAEIQLLYLEVAERWFSVAHNGLPLGVRAGFRSTSLSPKH